MSKKKLLRGVGASWGAGLDYLLKEHWDKLDQLVEDNYYGRHNSDLINYLFPQIDKVLEKSVLEMRRLCGKEGDKELLDGWIRKAKEIQSFGEVAKTLNEKVVFIDTVTQFLRETEVEVKRGAARKAKRLGRSERKVVLHKISEIKGVVASGANHRRIEGVIKVVLSESDFPKFKRGDILVVKETNASFLPIMKRARAFITDLGGVLCHAAIVARELKKHCIVGTKIATRALKDGDLVEVDAEKGVVRKLEK